MNIFITDPNPVLSAQALDNRRLNAQIKELSQMLCTALGKGPLQWSHYSHPATLWIERSTGNAQWALNFFIAMNEEFLFRTGKLHAYAEHFPIHQEHLSRTTKIKFGERADFYNGAKNSTLNLDFTMLPVFEAYKTYLNHRWPYDFARPRWTKRDEPEWADFIWIGRPETFEKVSTTQKKRRA